MITFNNIPNTMRTPGHYAEVDNSRALQGLLPNPHKALIIGQKTSSGSGGYDQIYAITKAGLADGYFGPGSVLARMCNVFKAANENTELHAMAIGSGAAGTLASGSIDFSTALADAEASVAGTYFLMVNGIECYTDIAISMSGRAIASLVKANVNAKNGMAVHASAVNGSVYFSALNSGTLGNYINIRHNYYAGQSIPKCLSREPILVSMAGGATDPVLTDAWAVIDGEQYQYIIQPWTTATALTQIETELATRFGPMQDLQGHGFTAVRGTQASCTTLGNSRNSPHVTIIGADDSPTSPVEWAAVLGAVASKYLNQDPARPLQYLKMPGVLAPPLSRRFSRSERDILLYDGIATWICDSVGNVLLERCITTYQTNSFGLTDPSYLDVETLATLSEIRYQYKARMVQRFIIPRFKLADDSFPVQAGTYVATPKTIRSEIISLFSQLQDAGLIENIEDFIVNLLVERDSIDRNRVNVLLPPDLINQFRILAGNIQFIL